MHLAPMFRCELLVIGLLHEQVSFLDLIGHDDAERTSMFKTSYSLYQSAVGQLMVGL